MRKVDLFGDKEYIVHVTNSYTVFRFPDGSKTRLETCKEQLVPVLGWYRTEMQFYDRMQRELNAQYEKQKEVFDTSSHYYTDEKIADACQKDLFALFDLQYANKKYLQEWNAVSGIQQGASFARDRYWQLYKIATQLQTVVGGK